MSRGQDDLVPSKLATSGGLRVGAWWIEPDSGQLVSGDETVRVEPKAMEVLVYLASRPGEVISREDLEHHVWRGALVGYDAVTNTIIKLRKALGDNAREPRYIVTVPKRGYRLVAPVGLGHEESARDQDRPEYPMPPQPGRKRSSVRRTAWSLAIMVAVVLAGAALLVYRSRDNEQPLAQDLTRSQSIVVLPFENLSDDAEQEIFADGITEDIITDLSRLSGLQVIAGNTSFTYKGRRVKPRELRADLQVDFVLDGSIRRQGDALRINAQLVDARTGFQKWAARFDRPIGELFDVQDAVTGSIADALALRISEQEQQRLAQRSTGNLQAYDAFLDGQRLSKLGTEETNQQARNAYVRAIELDPAFGRAYGALAVTMAVAFRRGWTNAPVETLDRAGILAKKAVALDGTIPQTHWALGYVYLMQNEHEKAEAAAAEAISIAPNFADGYGLLALINNNLGQPEKAIDQITEGMRLNPYYTWGYTYKLGRAYYMLGRYEDAIAALEKAQERN